MQESTFHLLPTAAYCLRGGNELKNTEKKRTREPFFTVKKFMERIWIFLKCRILITF